MGETKRAKVTLTIPAPSSELLINLLGLFGLLGLAVAVGGLTHNWFWSLAVASIEAVLLSIVAATNREEPAAAERPAGTLPRAA